MGDNRILRNVIDTTWRQELAYVVGLIAADGWLRSDSYSIGFVSRESSLINLYRKALNTQKKARKRPRGGEVKKKYFTICFKSKQFYSFLRSIGIHPKKSKTIQKVELPDDYFADFVRGLYDGDGTFWTAWDKRWPKSFVYYLGLSSASMEFVIWIKTQLTRLYGVKGYIHGGKGAYTIRYVKGDTRRLFKIMYYKPDLLYLRRKHDKIRRAIEFDRKLHQSRKTSRGSSVVVALP